MELHTRSKNVVWNFFEDTTDNLDIKYESVSYLKIAMFVMKWAEKSGILKWMAPRRKDKQEMEASGDLAEARAEQEQQQAEAQRQKEAEEQRRRYVERKRRLLSDQKEREDRASEAGMFVKNQRALYLHKASGQQVDAQVVGVHHDDGPDNPYYTIQYQPSQDGERIEKQTTGDRLDTVEWDEESSWEIMSKMKR